jgi:hypothetical protein
MHSLGGGFSSYSPLPSWQATQVQAYLQSGVDLPSHKHFNESNRAYPDVSALGHNYIIQWGGSPVQVDGYTLLAFLSFPFLAFSHTYFYLISLPFSSSLSFSTSFSLPLSLYFSSLNLLTIQIRTSCSSPVFGAMIALMNSARLDAGKSPLGFINPVLYAAANQTGMFNDIFTLLFYL